MASSGGSFSLLRTLNHCKFTVVFHLLTYIPNFLDYKRDCARWFWLKQKLIWVPYERYEYTRLTSIRQDMDNHRTYKKENIVDDEENEEDIMYAEEPNET